jgi:hypothetical protein
VGKADYRKSAIAVIAGHAVERRASFKSPSANGRFATNDMGVGSGKSLQMLNLSNLIAI